MNRIYKIKLKLTKDEIYEIITNMPEHIADDIINQIEKQDFRYKDPNYFKNYYKAHREEMLKQQKEHRSKVRER